ncbi:YegS/Rv2252/BmrU family lipid kinase [Microbacterium sp. NPDC055903]
MSARRPVDDTSAHVAVVVNPAARGGTSDVIAERAVARLEERGAVVTRFAAATADAAATSTALRDACSSSPDAVVAIGGDGTARLAVDALHGTGIPLVLIPAGTGNDFAAALGLPRDPRSAADLVFDGSARAVDVAAIRRDDGTETLFCSVFASGFDSKVNERANRMRWPRGRARYNIAIGIEFALLKSIPSRISWLGADGAEHTHEGPLLLTAVGNTTSYGGGIPICPTADASDGILDLTLVTPASRLRLIRVLAQAFRGRHIDEPEVVTHRVRSVRIEADDLTGYADGDPMGRLPVTISILPGALRMMLPV